jgi:hypothetical protein
LPGLAGNVFFCWHCKAALAHHLQVTTQIRVGTGYMMSSINAAPTCLSHHACKQRCPSMMSRFQC